MQDVSRIDGSVDRLWMHVGHCKRPTRSARDVQSSAIALMDVLHWRCPAVCRDQLSRRPRVTSGWLLVAHVGAELPQRLRTERTAWAAPAAACAATFEEKVAPLR